MCYYISLLISIIRSLLYVYFNRLVFKIHGVSFGENFAARGSISLLKHPQGKFSIGDNVRINSGYDINPFGGEHKVFIRVNKSAQLKIGNGVALSNCSIHCFKKIYLEDNVMIGGGVKIFDTDFHALSSPNVITKPVIIKKNAFVGGYSIIQKGVTIGENAIIAAGSVVTKDVPDKEMWGGHPACFIRSIEF